MLGYTESQPTTPSLHSCKIAQTSEMREGKGYACFSVWEDCRNLAYQVNQVNGVVLLLLLLLLLLPKSSFPPYLNQAFTKIN